MLLLLLSDLNICVRRNPQHRCFHSAAAFERQSAVSSLRIQFVSRVDGRVLVIKPCSRYGQFFTKISLKSIPWRVFFFFFKLYGSTMQQLFSELIPGFFIKMRLLGINHVALGNRWFQIQFHRISSSVDNKIALWYERHRLMMTSVKKNWNGASKTTTPQWVQMIWNRRIHFIDKNLFPMSSVASEWASERTN